MDRNEPNDVTWEDAITMNEKARELSREQRLVNARTAPSAEILVAFRNLVIGSWTIEDASAAIVRERNAATAQMLYAQWLRSEPTAEEIAELLS